MIAGTLIIMFSCTKENNESVKQTSPAESNLSQQDIKVNNLIKTFKEKVLYYKANPGLKDGETVPVDSALWYLEATINYSHAFPNEYYSDFDIDTSYLTVPVNGDGTVDMATLTQKYEEMKTNVAADYHNSQFTEKGLKYVDLEEYSSTVNELTLEVKTATGEKNNDPPPFPAPDGPFEVGDDWWYGETLGHCYEPYVINDNAANQLYLATKDLVPDPAGNYYFINEFGFDISGGDNNFRRENDTEDNYLDYYLYYSIDGTQLPFNEDEMLCLEFHEMNWYYNFMKQLMFNILPDEYLPQHFGLENYDIVSLDGIEWKKQINYLPYYYYHKAFFTFGYKIFYDDDNGPVEL